MRKNNNVGAGLDQPAEKNKGITLISLIITIIVMLILVAVSISIALNTGLFDAAGKATQKTSIAKEQEKELASGKVNIDNKVYNSIDEYISGLGNGGTDLKPGDRATEGNATYKGVTIPKGFTVSKIDGEYEDVSKGLVIYDIPADDLKDKTKVDWTNPDTVKTNYNQFVWIPVVVNKTIEPKDTETSIASFRRSYWEDSSNGGTRSEDIPNDGTDNYTEPYAYDTNDYDGADGTRIKAQIAELTKSIYKYEGFYIARYEAGVDGNTARTTSNKPQDASFVVKQDKYPYNYVMWGATMRIISTGGAVYLSNNLYPSTNTNYGAASMLCTGACWDAVLDFVKDSSHNVKSSGSWGNYYDSETYKVYRGSLFQNSAWSLADTTNGTDVTKNTSIILTTGATERNSSKNIYDIAGNCYEWTTEANSTYRRVLRGGEYSLYGSSVPASIRISGYPDDSSLYADVSFRPTLYIK